MLKVLYATTENRHHREIKVSGRGGNGERGGGQIEIPRGRYYHRFEPLRPGRGQDNGGQVPFDRPRRRRSLPHVSLHRYIIHSSTILEKLRRKGVK